MSCVGHLRSRNGSAHKETRSCLVASNQEIATDSGLQAYECLCGCRFYTTRDRGLVRCPGPLCRGMLLRSEQFWAHTPFQMVGGKVVRQCRI